MTDTDGFYPSIYRSTGITARDAAQASAVLQRIIAEQGYATLSLHGSGGPGGLRLIQPYSLNGVGARAILTYRNLDADRIERHVLMLIAEIVQVDAAAVRRLHPEQDEETN